MEGPAQKPSTVPVIFSRPVTKVPFGVTVVTAPGGRGNLPANKPLTIGQSGSIAPHPPQRPPSFEGPVMVEARQREAEARVAAAARHQAEYQRKLQIRSALLQKRLNKPKTANLLGLSNAPVAAEPNLLRFEPTKEGVASRENELRSLFNGKSRRKQRKSKRTRKANRR